MSSLRDLLTQDGFHRHRPTSAGDSRRRARRPSPSSRTESAATTVASDAPTTSSFLCRDRKSVDISAGRLRHHGSPTVSSGRTTTSSARGSSLPPPSCGGDTAAISVLSGYVGQFSDDPAFRRRIHERCSICLAPRRRDSAHAALVNLDMAIATVERLAEKQAHRHHRSLRNCAKLLDLVASLSSPKLRAGCSCGVPNLHLAAVAQLYLAVVHKMRGDDGGAAGHLLQLFCDVPHLARKSLLPELWENFFLPRLVHLEVWFDREREALESAAAGGEGERRKWLYRTYSDQMDLGTMQLAIHYKQCLLTGDFSVAAPPVPLPPPPPASYRAGSGKRSASVPPSSLAANPQGDVAFQRSRAAVGESEPRPRKPRPFGFLSCRSDPTGGDQKHRVPGESNPNAGASTRRATPEKPRISGNSIPRAPLLDLDRAISSISTSNNLGECELAVGVISKAWIESHGDPAVAAALSTAPVVEGLLEVLFASNDEAISELAMAVLAELVARSEVNRKVVLSADPKLETFLKLFSTRGLFLKAAVLLYLLKPRAKHMPSPDWIPLVLRVLEHGDRRQRLFSVHCRPSSAAFYLLDQLLQGFDVDRNTENAKQVVALGGLGMLLRRFEEGDDHQMYSATHLLVTCVRAEESCREFLAERMKKASVMELLAGNRPKSRECALSLLVELVSLCRRTRVRPFLNDLKNEGCLNAMHILLVYLQQAPAEQRPLAAAILLQIDLLGDPLQYSVHREEAIDALVEAMDCSSRRKVQESCSRALCLLCGRFSRNGEASMEAWLLKKAGLDSPAAGSSGGKETMADELTNLDEEEAAMEDWRRRFSSILLHRGSERFSAALSSCLTHGIPSLARSCLLMVAWMSISVSPSPGRGPLWASAWSPLIPSLLNCLSCDRAVEERVLAAFSLRNLTRNSECLPKLLPLGRQSASLLHGLAEVTWAAREILLAAAADPAPSSARPMNSRRALMQQDGRMDRVLASDR